jgi:hypothetical protein
VSFYGEFNIDVTMLDLPVYNFAIESMFGLENIFRFVVMLLVPIVLVRESYFAIRRWESQKPWVVALKRVIEDVESDVRKLSGTYLPRLVAVFFVAVIFLITIMSANWEGVKAARRQWNDGPHAHLAFKSADRQQYEPRLLKANDERRLSLLAQTKDLVVVFERPQAATPPGHVFVLERKDIASVYIWP